MGKKKKPQPPQITDEERQQRLAKAMTTRRVRSEAKANIKINPRYAIYILSNKRDDEFLGGMRTVDVLKAVPTIGPITADIMLDEVKVLKTRRVRALNPRQVRELCSRLNDVVTFLDKKRDETKKRA